MYALTHSLTAYISICISVLLELDCMDLNLVQNLTFFLSLKVVLNMFLTQLSYIHKVNGAPQVGLIA